MCKNFSQILDCYFVQKVYGLFVVLFNFATVCEYSLTNPIPMKKKSIFVLSMFFIVSLFSQSGQFDNGDVLFQKADSLLKKDDRASIKLAGEIMDVYGHEDEYFLKSTIIYGIGYKNLGKYDSSLYYTNMGLNRALEIGDTVKIIKLYSSRGVVHYLRADYTDAINDFKSASKFYETDGDGVVTESLSPLHYAKILNNVASAYIKTGKVDSALSYFIKSLKIREENNAPERMLAVSKLNIGSIYLTIKDYEKGGEWMNQALEAAKQNADSGLMAKCYSNLGIIAKKTGDMISAIGYYSQSLIICENIGSERDEAIALQNLELLYMSQEKYDRAYKYSHKALAINKRLKANNAAVHLGLTNLFCEKNNCDSTIYHGKLALQMSKESGDVTTQTEAYKLLYDAYKNKNKPTVALQYFEQYVTLKDSTLNKENMEYIQDLKAKFETEKKENEIEFLKKLNESEAIKAKAVQSRQQVIILFSLLGIVLLIVLFVIYRKKRKKEKDLMIVEQKLLKTELHNKELASKELQLEVVYRTKQLTTHALNMMQKNQMLTDIREKLQGIAKQVKDDLTMDFKSMIRDINQIQKTEKDWVLFKKYFENVNKDFNKKLRKINPDLSTNDYRLAALISLNLNIKETAAVLNIAPNSVKLARHRLRKRLNLNTGDDLYVFLSKL